MHIRLATREDLAEIATVASRAMMEDELSLWLSPKQQEHPHLHRERCLQTNRRRWNTGLYLLVAVLDENDKEWVGKSTVIGFAGYGKEVGAPDDSSRRRQSVLDAFERWHWSLVENYNYYVRDNLGTSKSRFQALLTELTTNKISKRFDKYWELSILCVDPVFHRRGIGASLIDWGKEQATRDAVPLWLWSSVKGFPLYKRQGFEEFGRYEFGQKEITAPAMVWYPKREAVSSDLAPTTASQEP